MKLKQVLLGTMLVASLSAASAAQKHYEAFTLDYNDDTVLGDPASRSAVVAARPVLAGA